MNNWLDIIARYVMQREALAEAILVEALRSPRTSRKLQKMVGIDLRWNLQKVTSQEWSVTREARHDIVLTSAKGRQVRIELKGDAPFTKRQNKALRKGSEADSDIRIDVLIMPGWRHMPENLGAGVAVVRWEEIDRILGLKKLGSLASLWLGDVRLGTERLTSDAKQYIKYWKTRQGDLSWRSLWQTLQFIRAQFSSRLQFSRIDGSKTPGDLWYYGFTVFAKEKEKHFWLGWVFRIGKNKQLHLSLVALEDPNGLRLRGAKYQPYSGTSIDNDRMVKLWEKQSEAEVLDLFGVCRALGKCCGVKPL